MSSGLVGHWKFNEKSGTTANDSSRYKNTGTLTGATLPKWGEKGIIFDGVDDYVDAGNDASLNITNAITISAWIQTSSTDTRVIAGVFNVVGDSYWFGILNGAASFNVGGFAVTEPIATVNNGNFHHIVGIDSSQGFYIFVDGILRSSEAYVILNVSNTPFIIGSFAGAFYFNGFIDEVRIYNRALSQLEIKRLYNSTKHKYI